ncbi:MAG: flagellar hook-basal body complex protein FliE [Methylocystaceae bacterium]
MKMSEIAFKALTPMENPFAAPKLAPVEEKPVESFANLLQQKLNEVDGLQKQAADQATRVATGDAEYIHQAIISQEKAYLALQLTVEVRNKLVEAYQEITRMQM